MVRKRSLFGLCFAFAVLIAGCSSSTPPPDLDARKDDSRPGEHAHKPGKHGGVIVSIGGDSYHAEAIFEKGGVVRLLMLAKDESSTLAIEDQTMRAYVKKNGSAESASFVLKPEPQSGDDKGKSSQFAGRLPRELDGQKLDIAIPALLIGGEPFHVAFRNYSESGDGHETAIPAKAEDEEERVLYLTSGGKYTARDIEANGSTVASNKFKGAMASHDLKPKKGEKICPITLTKANPKFTWTVGGKSYQFCCPPCVDEFVKLAKEKPDEIKPPEEYIK